MAPDLVEERRGAPYQILPADAWERVGDKTYECRVLLVPEEVGGFSAHALRLPGVVSQGDTVDEAIANITEAFRAAIQCYLEDGCIPWADAVVERVRGSEERWILVNV